MGQIFSFVALPQFLRPPDPAPTPPRQIALYKCTGESKRLRLGEGSGVTAILDRKVEAQKPVPMILRLGDEITLEIFKLASQRTNLLSWTESDDARQAHQAIMEVCPQWKRLLTVKAPWMWNKFTLPSAHYQEFLQYSMPFPLDVVIEGFPPTNVEAWMPIALLGESKVRLRSLTLIIDAALRHSDVPAACWIFEPLPNIECFEVYRRSGRPERCWGNDEDSAFQGLLPFDGIAPNIRSIAISSIYVPNPFRSLTNLLIHRVQLNTTTAIRELFGAIEDSPGLERICLEDIEIPCSELDKLPLETIHLPHLQVLSLRLVGLRLTRFLLGHITAPPQSLIDIQANISRGGITLVHVLPTDLSGLPTFRNIRHMKVSTTRHGTPHSTVCVKGAAVIGEMEGSVEITLIGGHVDLLRQIASSFEVALPLPGLCTLTLKSFASSRKLPFTSHAFRAAFLLPYSTLRRLAFIHCDPNFVRTLIIKNRQPICPNLEVLHISGDNVVMEDAVDIVASRAVVAPLRRLEIQSNSSLDGTSIESLRRFVTDVLLEGPQQGPAV